VRRLTFLAPLVFAAVAHAEETAQPTALERTLEMPAHQALLNRATKPDVALTPFETDGCSGGLSTAWRVVANLFPDFAETHRDIPPWEACCVSHDRLYHNAAGAKSAEDSFTARFNADEALRQCVMTKGATRVPELAQVYDVEPIAIERAYETIGSAMFSVVRFGGGPCTGLPWRWGFGYPGCLPGF
jgi:hypothetical protein